MFENLNAELVSLTEIMFINIVLSGDNAVVVGMAAAGVRHDIRRKVILWGMGGAVALRIIFALLATQLLAVVGLTLAGGVLLLWVCWKMYREMTAGEHEDEMALAVADGEISGVESGDLPTVKHKTFGQAMTQIVIADVSMSLDNVLAVAGAAKNHLGIMAIGLLISVALMGLAASLIASLLTRYRWIAWIGLLIILYVAIEMIWNGSHEVACHADLKEICQEGIFGWMKASVVGR